MFFALIFHQNSFKKWSGNKYFLGGKILVWENIVFFCLYPLLSLHWREELLESLEDVCLVIFCHMSLSLRCSFWEPGTISSYIRLMNKFQMSPHFLFSPFSNCLQVPAFPPGHFISYFPLFKIVASSIFPPGQLFACDQLLHSIECPW